MLLAHTMSTSPSGALLCALLICKYNSNLSHTTDTASTLGTSTNKLHVHAHHSVDMNGSISDSVHKMSRDLYIGWGTNLLPR